MRTLNRLIFSLLVVSAFCPLLNSSAQRRQPEPGPPSRNDYIVIFDRPNYSGRSVNYSGPNPSIPNNGQSVTIVGGVWELCEGRNFSGRCLIFDRSVPDFSKYVMSYRVFSVRPAGSEGPIPPPSAGDWNILVYDRTSYRGNAISYPDHAPDASKPARSVRIPSGTWQLCQGRNFMGRCVTLNRSVPDLRVYKIRHVSSVRVVTRQRG